MAVEQWSDLDHIAAEMMRERLRDDQVSIAGGPSGPPRPGACAPVPWLASGGGVMTRDEITQAVTAAKLARGLSWQELADAIGKPVVWVAAALLGQHPLDPADASILATKLGLPEEAVPILATVPMRGALPTAVPTDPTIYRLYEVLQVYGPALKELIHEQFGDGIMSAINFGVSLERREHPAGDRVVITLDGKFLPYEWPST
jgi:cyanate lyase